PALSAGAELVVLARAPSGTQGVATLSGNVSGKPFAQDFQFAVNLSDSLGNAYVARLWAEQSIRALELADAALNRNQIVDLSQRFGLVSRHTSLLTLESDEMRREFGVRKDRSTRWDPNAPSEESITEPLAAKDNNGISATSSDAAEVVVADEPSPNAGIGTIGTETGGSGRGGSDASGAGLGSGSSANGLAINEDPSTSMQAAEAPSLDTADKASLPDAAPRTATAEPETQPSHPTEQPAFVDDDRDSEMAGGEEEAKKEEKAEDDAQDQND